VAETEEYMREKMGEEGEIDLLDAMSYLTILTASRCLLGREVREHMFGEVYNLLREIDEGINPIAIINPNLPIPSFRRRDKARAQLAQIFGAVITARRNASGEKPEDMLQAFIDATYADGKWGEWVHECVFCDVCLIIQVGCVLPSPLLSSPLLSPRSLL
jgi:sterol 14-demethylase